MFSFIKHLLCNHHDYVPLKVQYYWQGNFAYGCMMKVEEVDFICKKCGKRKTQRHFIHPIYYTDEERKWM